MAGDWLKMRTDLADDPAVIAIADAMDLREEFVVGLLHCFWAWVDKQCADGIVVGITIESVERRLRLDGLLVQMCRVGWLVYEQEDGQPILRIPKFERHLGENAKSRAHAAERQRKSRHGHVTKNCDTSVTPVTKSCDKSVTREEKRREEIIQEDTNVSSPPPSESDDSEELVEGLEFVTTKGQQTHRMTRRKLQEYQDAFPGIDVLAQLRTAAQWLRDNPKNRKTKAGVPRFLTNWLARAQNSARPSGNGRAPPGPSKPDPVTDRTNELTKLVQAARRRGYDRDWIEEHVHRLDRQGLPIDEMKRSLANAFKQEA